jgi:hypothetical protein
MLFFWTLSHSKGASEKLKCFMNWLYFLHKMNRIYRMGPWAELLSNHATILSYKCLLHATVKPSNKMHLGKELPVY